MEIGIYWGRTLKRVVLLFGGLAAELLVFTMLLADIEGVLWQSVPVFHLEPAEMVLCFPYKIEGTSLIAERVAVYEGPFLEDGSDDEVSNVTALVLRNVGYREVSQAEIVLRQGNRYHLFRASNIPAGAAVLVLERCGNPYSLEAYTECRGWSTTEEVAVLPPQLLQVKAVGMGQMAITNLSDTMLENIVLYYKTWSGEAGLYIGGVTYKTLIRTIDPGECLYLEPYHFVSGYSQVLKAEIKAVLS